MTTSVRTRIVEPIDPADFLANSQAIQSDLEALHSPTPPRSTPRFPAWAIALAAGLGFAGGFGLAGWLL
jgi:hypothetical protein